MRKMKKLNKGKIFYLIMGILIIALVAVIGVNAYKDFFKKGEEPTIIKKELDSLELYGYTLDDLDTEIYKKYFNELKEILNSEEVDEEEYAKAVVKLFVTDFYTLENKITSSDFGGLEFIHPDALENFKLKAGDTLYNHVKTNLDGKRDQDLPYVEEVTIVSAEKTTFNEQEAYQVKASWSYKEDLGYQTSANFYLIKDENKLYIVEED